jgi:uncharacterized membrane protein
MYLALLALHFLGLALALGAGFAQLTLQLATSGLGASDRSVFALRALALGKNSSYGLLLLILSGGGMTAMRGVTATFQAGGPAFHAKLTAVAIMFFVLGYSQVVSRRAKRAAGVADMARLRSLGRLQLLLGIVAVVCAVIAFK